MSAMPSASKYAGLTATIPARVAGALVASSALTSREGADCSGQALANPTAGAPGSAAARSLTRS